ncbi:hypothetical protein Aduo_004823 [Ancylostoma duodenale]
MEDLQTSGCGPEETDTACGPPASHNSRESIDFGQSFVAFHEKNLGFDEKRKRQKKERDVCAKEATTGWTMPMETPKDPFLEEIGMEIEAPSTSASS